MIKSQCEQCIGEQSSDDMRMVLRQEGGRNADAFSFYQYYLVERTKKNRLK